MENKKERLLYFDIARIIGLFGIMLCHYLIRKSVFTDLRYVISLYDVPIFFVASGYFLKKTPMKEFLKSKWKSLIIPYLFCSIVLTILLICKGWFEAGFISKTYALERILAIFYGSGYKYIDEPLHVYVIYGIWFLLGLFFAMLIVRLFIDNKLRGLIYLAISILGFITSKYFWLPLSIQSGMVACIFVYFGLLLKEKNILEKINIKTALLTLVLFIGCVVLSVKFSLHTSLVVGYMSYYIVGLILSLISTFFLIVLSMYIEKIPLLNTFLVVLGQNSLSILLIHLITYHVVNYNFLGFYFGLNVMTIVYLSMIAPLICHVLMIIIVNKSKFLSKMLNVKIRRTNLKDYTKSQL